MTPGDYARFAVSYAAPTSSCSTGGENVRAYPSRWRLRDHPEAYGHISLHRGQFVLRDNRDGTTTLFGSSWYTLHVRPRWYFDLWTRDMTRAVHLRVMNHVKRLSEQTE